MVGRRRRAAVVVAVLSLSFGGACAADPKPAGTPVTQGTPTTNGPATTAAGPGPTAGSATTAPAASGLVLASSKGVSMVPAGGGPAVRVSTAAARVAYGVGGDFVVFQNQPAVPGRSEPVKVWSAAGGVVRELAAGTAPMTYVTLLDAGRVGGEAVAFVSEHSGGMPSDTFEELVRVRLRDGARTVLVRRPSWESGHSRARLLDGGDFLADAHAETSAALERWRPETTKPQWSIPLGSADGPTTFTAFSPTGVATVERRSGTALVVTDYDAATGKPGPSRTVPVKDATALSCGEWLTATDLLCARTDATPVALSVMNGSLRELSAEVGATATVVR